jgi:hypothetical protein
MYAKTFSTGALMLMLLFILGMASPSFPGRVGRYQRVLFLGIRNCSPVSVFD